MCEDAPCCGCCGPQSDAGWHDEPESMADRYENEREIEGDCEPDDSMDGDHESALASAGMGTDEDYGYYGEDCHLDSFGEE